jgi:hypothetical protein
MKEIKFRAWDIRPKIDFTGKTKAIRVFSEQDAKDTVANLKELGFTPSVVIKENVFLRQSIVEVLEGQ